MGRIYTPEKWFTMAEEERAAIFRLAGAEDGNDLLQEEDLNDNCYPNDAEAAVEVDDGDEWQPEKKRKKQTRQSRRRPGGVKVKTISFILSLYTNVN